MNIILITLDGLAASYMEIYKDNHYSPFFEEKAKTPFLKELLKDSVKFNRCYTNSNMTVAATRELNEGRFVRYPLHERIDPDFPLSKESLPTKLQERSFFTGAFLGDGEWIFKGMRGKYDNFEIIPGGITPILELSRKWLLVNRLKKCFLWCHIPDTHMCTVQYYSDKIMGYKDWSLFKNFKRSDFRCRFDEDMIESKINLPLAYAKSISYCDEEIGNFIQFLKKEKMYKRSCIIISADHGSSYGDPSKDYGFHDLPYDNVTHIPLIVKLPFSDQLEGKEIEHFVQTIDIPKTILDLAGISTPLCYEGSNLFRASKDFVVTDGGPSERVFGVRTHDWSYIQADGDFDFFIENALYHSDDLSKNVYDSNSIVVEKMKRILTDNILNVRKSLLRMEGSEMSKASFWEIRSQRYDNLDWVNNDLLLNRCIDECLYYGEGGISLLDIGTGTGKILKKLKEFRPFDLYGIDISKDMLLVDEDITTKVLDVYDLSEATFNKKFDVVIARMLFHHLERHKEAIGCVRSVLKDTPSRKGKIIICEGVPPDEEADGFFNVMFSLKEDRYPIKERAMMNLLYDCGFRRIRNEMVVIENCSMNNWLDNSGIDVERIKAIKLLHKYADEKVKNLYHMREVDGDILMDWKFSIFTGILAA